jgi:hypothetical protein
MFTPWSASDTSRSTATIDFVAAAPHQWLIEIVGVDDVDGEARW